MPRNRLHRLTADPERGAVSVWIAVASFAMIVLVGMTVDLAGQVQAQQHARQVAAQAARTGGQQLQAPEAIRGVGVEAAPGRAVQAARDYLAASDVAGAVRVRGDELVVTTTDTYQTKFLSIIGLNSFQVTGSAEVSIVQVVQGEQTS